VGPKNKKEKYKKYVFWLGKDDFVRFRDETAQKGLPLHEAKKAVCVPLSKRVESGFVPPGAWDEYPLCKRQLSWYKGSPYFGLTLVVSSNELEGFGLRPQALIKERKFRPPRFPDREEKLKMRRQKAYQQARPAEWEDLSGEDPQIQERWLKVMGIRGMSYEELFITHCANHANFIDPRYYVVEEDGPVPYSIDKTTHICSACLEFFNIIGAQFKKKLVVPCPGAVLFAGMAPNRYYEVVQLS